jgi:hypothetical protein
MHSRRDGRQSPAPVSNALGIERQLGIITLFILVMAARRIDDGKKRKESISRRKCGRRRRSGADALAS